MRMTTSDTTLRRLRALAIIEGMSLIALVAVAVPLKHALGFPLAVKVMGPLHGLAFLAYTVALIDALGTGQLAWRRAGAALVAAMIPGGSFLVARSSALASRDAARKALESTPD